MPILVCNVHRQEELAAGSDQGAALFTRVLERSKCVPLLHTLTTRFEKDPEPHFVLVGLGTQSC